MRGETLGGEGWMRREGGWRLNEGAVRGRMSASACLVMVAKKMRMTER
jgi:hypothetical protein